ncbi:MAG TPA: signal peptidase II [Noviherbaspirillum sp.]|nr:signal peptidase II [Noviherbaspirillum sp.]
MAKQKSFQSLSSSQRTSMVPWLGIAAIIVLLDQITKITVTKVLAYGESIPVTSFFNLVLAYNKGAAFSFLAAESGWQRYLFTGIATAAAIFIIYLLKRHAGQRLFCWALALILGGAVGNLIDRVLYGHVIDFLDFYVSQWHWPAFNIADMAIVGGAGLFIIDELKRVGK